MKIIENRCPSTNSYELEVPYNIVIERYYSEEERAENFKNSKAILAAGNNAWNEHCEVIRKKFAAKIDMLLTELERHFEIGQLHDDGDKYPNYDLWFWCNSGDHSYITLTFMRHYNGEDTEKIVEDTKRIKALSKKAMEILDAYNDPNLCAALRFSTVELPQGIAKEARNKAINLNGKWTTFDGIIGKFWIGDNGEYCFKKKYSKKRSYYILNPAMVIRCEVA